MLTALSRVLSILVLVVAGAVQAATEPARYQVGDVLAPFSAYDQHGKPFAYEPGSTRLVLVAFAMGPGKAANAFFEQQPAGFLEQHRAVFISNIHGMPGIARTFALPKMRKYPHRIVLADTEGFLARYPEKEDFLTVVTLDDAGKITGLQQVDPKQGLPAVFARK